jgi:hypothetical protein
MGAMQHSWIVVALGIVAAACTSTYDPLEDYEELTPTRITSAPELPAGLTVAQDPESPADGKYLVELIGCGVCHTDGALIGEPQLDEWLAGSDVGIAYSDPLQYDDPGVVFPSNLTPDPGTGLGRWSDEEIIAAMRAGHSRDGGRLIQAMPWLVYSMLSDEDSRAIVAYLRSLPPVAHEVPREVTPGIKTSKRFVHFGVYRSRR